MQYSLLSLFLIEGFFTAFFSVWTVYFNVTPYLFIYMCECVFVCAYHGMCVEVRRQLVGVILFF